MAERAGATITEVEGSHVIMISQPQVVADVILTAVAAVGKAGGPAGTVDQDTDQGLPWARRAALLVELDPK
jgi:hypothetical protein